MKTINMLLIIVAALLAIIAGLLVAQIILPEKSAENEESIWTSLVGKEPDSAEFNIRINADQIGNPISPLIYGLSGGSSELTAALRTPHTSWGGNTSTRYNWEIGNAWNAGRDWEYRNGNYGHPPGSAADQSIFFANVGGMTFRLAVPTLGWVAKNDDGNTCSFPLPGGGCGYGGDSKCEEPNEIADPTIANVESSPEKIMEWMRHLKDENLQVQFISMDNEPELWGYTHYDIHPTCTTYDEILQKHIEYSTAVRSVMPEVEITGPSTCCWWFYWNSAAGEEDKQAHGGQDFLPWFLAQVYEHDKANDIQTLNVLDIHYYPEDLYNSNVSPDVAAQRLRSTRSLWDKEYSAESWIDEPIYLIPRMQELIAEHYPGLKLGISEWNFGADQHMNGALAIADTLGIYGREGLYFANYWRYPELNSPGFFAFKMYTNYDDQGGEFGDISVFAQSDDADIVSSFASIDTQSGDLHIVLINKQVDRDINIQLDLENFAAHDMIEQYFYSQHSPGQISSSNISADENGLLIQLPAYSISHLILKAAPLSDSTLNSR